MDAPQLTGRWQMIRAEFAGEAAPDLVAQRTELRFTADTYHILFDAIEKEAGRFELEGDSVTRALTLHAIGGPNAGRKVACIFQLVGDRLRICYGLDGHLPQHFRTGATEPRYLATYRRLPD